MKKIANRRNYIKMKKYAGYFGSNNDITDPLHEAHMLSTEDLVNLVNLGKPPDWFAGKTKMDEEVQDLLGIEWDDVTASYVEKGQGSDLSSNVDDIIDQMRGLSAEDRQKILLALGDGGALDAKQAARKRRLNRLTKR